MTYIFLPDAQEELYEAAFRYDAEKEGLGDQFCAEIGLMLARILANPTLPRLRGGRYRRVNSNRFPYYVAYTIRAETVVILAVAHGRRRPGYWRKRLR
jgi:plasmid stabilization system protein ParE